MPKAPPKKVFLAGTDARPSQMAAARTRNLSRRRVAQLFNVPNGACTPGYIFERNLPKIFRQFLNEIAPFYSLECRDDRLSPLLERAKTDPTRAGFSRLVRQQRVRFSASDVPREIRCSCHSERRIVEVLRFAI